MPPIRRYVRISPHSCLEVRIFVDNPADISTWLLRPSKPALPRVFSAVKPLILPKLKEENERTRLAKGKSGKKKGGVKDVVKGEDFEVVIFLTEGQGRHEVVVKRKEARQTAFGRVGSIGGQDADPVIIREEDSDDSDEVNMANMANIPTAASDDEDEDDLITTKARQRQKVTNYDLAEDDDNADPLQDEKKKLGFKTRYEGFGIWGKVLCLLVERKGSSATNKRTPIDRRRNMNASLADGDNGDAGEGAQQALMQEWISSTQMPQDDEDDNG